MQIAVTNQAGASSSKVEIADGTFSVPFNEALIHQVLVAYMAGGRAGTRAQKTRSQVRGGGRKPWKQKGTGRARAGTIRSPLWRGGGKIFAATPQDHSQKVNSKMYRGALRSILSELVRQDRLKVVDSLKLNGPKTKQLRTTLNGLGAQNALIVLDAGDENIELAARNLPDVDVRMFDVVDPVSLVAYDQIIVTVAAIKKLEVRLQ